MRNVDYFHAIIAPWEGGKSTDPNDSGGDTMRGVTWNTLINVGYDTDKDHQITKNDLWTLTPEDVKLIIVRAGFYKPQYDKMDKRIAFFLTDWLWGGASKHFYKYVLPLVTKLNTLMPPEMLSLYCNLIRAQYYRALTTWRPKDQKYKPGWYAKHIQTSMRDVLQLNINPASIRSKFKYDKHSFTPVNTKI